MTDAVLPGDPGPDPAAITRLVAAALDEDLGPAPGRDVTSQSTIAGTTTGTADLVARADGVLAGLVVVPEVLAQVAARLGLPAPSLVVRVPDGTRVTRGDVLAELAGPVQALLVAERTLLNLASRASGVATHTRRWADALEGTGARVLDTRKTTPGLRALEKYAVRCGGGVNHRFGLDDAILIKDNHVAACGGVGEAVRRARAHAGHLVKVEVEVDGLDQLDEALKHGPDVVMLDNFSLDDLATAVRLAKGRAVLEASGGVNLTTVRAIAETGVDVISVGALTHSAPVLDIGLDAA